MKILLRQNNPYLLFFVIVLLIISCVDNKIKKEFDTNGRLVKSIEKLNRKKFHIKYFYPNGHIKNEYTLENHSINGKAISYDTTGQIIFTAYWENNFQEPKIIKSDTSINNDIHLKVVSVPPVIMDTVKNPYFKIYLSNFSGNIYSVYFSYDEYIKISKYQMFSDNVTVRNNIITIYDLEHDKPGARKLFLTVIFQLNDMILDCKIYEFIYYVETYEFIRQYKLGNAKLLYPELNLIEYK